MDPDLDRERVRRARAQRLVLPTSAPLDRNVQSVGVHAAAVGELVTYPQPTKRRWGELAAAIQEAGGQWVVVWRPRHFRSVKGLSAAVRERLERHGCHAQVVTLEGGGPWADEGRTWDGFCTFARAVI